VQVYQERRADDPQSQARFLHEAEVTGRLEHRGIVPVYGLGHFENGRPFYSMRVVNGTSLKDAIAKFHDAKSKDDGGVERSLELRRLLGTFVDVCNTVAYAHSRGVLHRDLKPANIILDEYGEQAAGEKLLAHPRDSVAIQGQRKKFSRGARIRTLSASFGGSLLSQEHTPMKG
jgi:eukaryotic-like serine/threonine-protein kinase